MSRERPGDRDGKLVSVPAGDETLEGNLIVPRGAEGVVLFAHGSGSSRFSPRNRYVAGVLNDAGLATLLIDLLTAEEERIDERTRHLRFDIDLLAERLVYATDWLLNDPQTKALHIGYFGSSTGAAAALMAEVSRSGSVSAVVSRGGRPDLASSMLSEVEAPTLLIVGSLDFQVIRLNEQALAMLQTEKKMELVPGATHLFEEPGTLEQAARLARDWFLQHLASSRARSEAA
jgi:putative phosphoribosyl transferase